LGTNSVIVEGGTSLVFIDLMQSVA
jgi:hypothetical protein